MRLRFSVLSVVSAATVVVVASLGLAQPAAAQQSDQERTALARSLFEQAVAHGEAGRWTEAADLYRRVLALRPTAHVKFNLAIALTHLGDIVEPAELSRQVIRDPGAPESARNDAQDLLASLEPRIATLTVRIEGDPEGATIRLDGAPLEAVSIGVGIPVDPGTHEVQALRGEEVVASASAEVAEGASGEVTLEVPPPPPPSEPAPVAVPTPAQTASAGTEGGASAGLGGGARVDDDDGGGFLPWVIVGGLVAVGAVVAIVLIAGGGDDPEQLDGNLMPGRIVFD